MKIKPRCIPCLLNRILFEAEQVTNNRAIQEKVMLKSMDILRKEYGDRSSVEIATKVHQAAYQILGTRDPYKKLKERSNRIALKMISKAERLIENSDDPIKAAAICSIIGNLIDFGIEGSISSPEKLEEEFDNFFEEGLGWNDLPEIKKLLKGDILFFADNCGEIVFDKILCRELKKYDIHLTLVVKGEPILTDATYEDAKLFNFDDVVDEILTTEGFAVGIDFDSSDYLLDRLENANLIICKGMGNYEAFSETKYKPIAYFLRTKCKTVAEDIGLPMNINAVKLFE